VNYKGYATRIEYSDEDGLFVGHIADIEDVIGFHGASVQAFCAAFEEAVTDYLDACAKLGRAPEIPFDSSSFGPLHQQTVT